MYERWLFAEHPQRELRAWAQRLGWFRFVRAASPADGDVLLAGAALSDAAAVDEALRSLGLDDPTSRPGGVAVEADGHHVWLRISGTGGDAGAVSRADVELAAALEAVAAPELLAAAIDPPLDGLRCIAPALHPNLFARPAGRPAGGH